MPGSERTIKVRQCSGGGHPRLILHSPSVIANLAPASPGDMDDDMRLPRGVYPERKEDSSPLAQKDKRRRARNDNRSGVLAMTYGGGSEVP